MLARVGNAADGTADAKADHEVYLAWGVAQSLADEWYVVQGLLQDVAADIVVVLVLTADAGEHQDGQRVGGGWPLTLARLGFEAEVGRPLNHRDDGMLKRLIWTCKRPATILVERPGLVAQAVEQGTGVPLEGAHLLARDDVRNPVGQRRSEATVSARTFTLTESRPCPTRVAPYQDVVLLSVHMGAGDKRCGNRLWVIRRTYKNCSVCLFCPSPSSSRWRAQQNLVGDLL